MFATPNVHSAASSAMCMAFRNAAQPQAQALRVSAAGALARRAGAVWARLLRPLRS